MGCLNNSWTSDFFKRHSELSGSVWSWCICLCKDCTIWNPQWLWVWVPCAPVALWGHFWAVDDPMGSSWEQQWPCALLWSRTPSLSHDFCCLSGRAWSAGTGISVQAPTALLKGLPDATDVLKVWNMYCDKRGNIHRWNTKNAWENRKPRRVQQKIANYVFKPEEESSSEETVSNLVTKGELFQPFSVCDFLSISKVCILETLDLYIVADCMWVCLKQLFPMNYKTCRQWRGKHNNNLFFSHCFKCQANFRSEFMKYFAFYNSGLMQFIHLFTMWFEEGWARNG